MTGRAAEIVADPSKVAWTGSAGVDLAAMRRVSQRPTLETHLVFRRQIRTSLQEELHRGVMPPFSREPQRRHPVLVLLILCNFLSLLLLEALFLLLLLRCLSRFLLLQTLLSLLLLLSS